MMKAFGYISAILTGLCIYGVASGAKHQIVMAIITFITSALCFWADGHDRKEEENRHA